MAIDIKQFLNELTEQERLELLFTMPKKNEFASRYMSDVLNVPHEDLIGRVEVLGCNFKNPDCELAKIEVRFQNCDPVIYTVNWKRDGTKGID